MKNAIIFVSAILLAIGMSSCGILPDNSRPIDTSNDGVFERVGQRSMSTGQTAEPFERTGENPVF